MRVSSAGLSERVADPLSKSLCLAFDGAGKVAHIPSPMPKTAIPPSRRRSRIKLLAAT